MTTKREETTGGRQIVPDRPFQFGSADNFVITWANVTFGVLNGKSFCSTPWREPEPAWLQAEILFLNQMLERITRYLEVRASEPDEAEIAERLTPVQRLDAPAVKQPETTKEP